MLTLWITPNCFKLREKPTTPSCKKKTRYLGHMQNYDPGRGPPPPTASWQQVELKQRPSGGKENCKWPLDTNEIWIRLMQVDKGTNMNLIKLINMQTVLVILQIAWRLTTNQACSVGSRAKSDALTWLLPGSSHREFLCEWLQWIGYILKAQQCSISFKWRET